MAVIRLPIPNIQDISSLRVVGLVMTAFGGISSLLVLFSPIGCTIVGAMGLLICGSIFIIGIVIIAASFLRNKHG